MGNSYCDAFKKNWDKFITRLQGQLITQAKNGVFTPASSNLILADCIGFWDSRHSEGGRWLDGFEKEYPDKAERIRNILLNDMKFKSNSSDESTQEYLRYLIPVGSAAAGFAISRIAGANAIVQAVCTIAPAVVSYPVASNVLHAAGDNRKKEIIQNYLSQLDKYRVSIESILQGMEYRDATETDQSG